LSWTIPGTLGAGTYRLSYEAKVNNFLKSQTVITNQAVMSYEGGGPVTRRAPVTVTGNYTVKIGVYNSAGELVKEILVGQYTQPVMDIVLEGGNTIRTLNGVNSGVTIECDGTPLGIWNGTSASGNLESNGEYYIQVDNVDSMGVVKSETKQVLVDRKVMTETVLIYNEAGELVRHLYGYTDDPGGNVAVGAKLSTSVIAPTYGDTGGAPRELTVVLSDGVTIVWDGKNDGGSFVEDGQYFMEIHSADGQGGDTTLTEKVTVKGGDEGKGVGKVKAEPNELMMGTGVGQTTFKCDGGMNMTLKVRIYTVSGELVETVEGGTGVNEAVWDARGKASGIYLAVVDLTDMNGGHVGRQIVKVLVVR
jgi:flagellar hook assembly protein FlgD